MLRRFHAAEVGVVVQRRQGRYLPNLVNHRLGDEGGLAEEAAAVGNAVAN